MKKKELLYCFKPEFWDTLIMNISKDTDLTYESTESTLLVEESRKKTYGCGSLYDAASVALSRFKERDGGGKDQDRSDSRGKNKGSFRIMERNVL